MKMNKKISMVAVAASALILGGCANTGDMYRSDVYHAGQVNQAQEVSTVNIIAIGPARVAVDNTENMQRAENFGMIIGAIAGAALAGHNHHHMSNRVAGGVAGGALGHLAGSAAGGGSSTTLVPGVQLTYRVGNRIFNSAQVGRPCEFKPGLAIMVSPAPNETRIQPNNPYGCPQPER
jgi:outer membrane lipoprotein SlyB